VQALERELLAQDSDHFAQPPPPPQPGLLWGLFRSRTPVAADSSSTPTSRTAVDGACLPPVATEKTAGLQKLVAKCKWLSDIAWLGCEVEGEGGGGWEAAEAELAAALGVPGGSAAVRVRCPALLVML
jgi:hypothetical protein